MRSRLLPPLAAFLFSAVIAGSFAGPAHAQTSETAPEYLALGDSLAFGVGADSPEDQGYVGLTYATIKSDKPFDTDGLDLLNISAPGATSSDLMQTDGQLDRAIGEIRARASDEIQGNEVRIVTLDIGGNDLLALAGPNSVCLKNASSRECQDGVTAMLGTLQDNLNSTLSRLRTAAPDANIYVIDLYNPYSGLTGDLALVASVGVQQVNGIIRVVASNPDYGAHLVTVFAAFTGRANQWIASDGIHPNNSGYRVMAEELTAAIEGRAAVIPADLLNPPTASAVDDPASSSSSGGVDTIVFVIALPLVFAAGALLSAAYFVMRGRA